jgi:hypothetical protein
MFFAKNLLPNLLVVVFALIRCTVVICSTVFSVSL